MSVIIFILKIIGIILLALLGILLVLIGLILFVPVRYRIAGSMEDEFTVQGNVSWMLHLFGFSFFYQEGGFQQQFKICGIRIGKKQKKKKKKKKDVLHEEEDGFVEQNVFITEYEPATEDEEEGSGEEKASVRPDTAGLDHSKERVREKKTIRRNIRMIWDRIRTAVRHARNTLLDIKNKIYVIKNFIADETNKKLFQLLWKELRYLLRHFKFRRINAELKFSLGDPENTGKALGILAMMPWLYRYQFHVCPDFEAEELYIEGVFDVKGRIRLIHAAVSAVRLLLQKECRAAIKKFFK